MATTKEKPQKTTAKKETAKSDKTKKTAAAKDTEKKAAAPKKDADKKDTAKKEPAKKAAAKSDTVKSGTTKKSPAKSAKSQDDDHSSHATTDHDEIKNWIESRGGKPATVKGTGKKSASGILRIDFPGYSGEDSLEEISWDEFFEKFDESKLEFLYQDKTADGKESRFSKFVSRTK